MRGDAGSVMVKNAFSEETEEMISSYGKNEEQP
jgi:hypothetical protein